MHLQIPPSVFLVFERRKPLLAINGTYVDKVKILGRKRKHTATRYFASCADKDAPDGAIRARTSLSPIIRFEQALFPRHRIGALWIAVNWN